MDESSKYDMEQKKKQDTKEYTQYDSINKKIFK